MTNKRKPFAVILTLMLVFTSVLPTYAETYMTLNQAILYLRDKMVAHSTTVEMNIDSYVDFTQENVRFLNKASLIILAIFSRSDFSIIAPVGLFG